MYIMDLSGRAIGRTLWSGSLVRRYQEEHGPAAFILHISLRRQHLQRRLRLHQSRDLETSVNQCVHIGRDNAVVFHDVIREPSGPPWTFLLIVIR